MERFESENLFEERPEPKKETTEKSFFERIYKSKTARILALLGGLSLGGKIAKHLAVESPPQETANVIEQETEPTYKESSELNLEDLSQKFKVLEEIPGREQFIIHIPNFHSGPTLKETEEAFGDKMGDFIQANKDAERLLIFLSEKYGITEFFAEGMGDHDGSTYQLIEGYKKKAADIDQSEDGPFYEKTDLFKNLYDAIADEKSDFLKKLPFSEPVRAWLIYWAYCESVKTAEALEGQYARYRAGDRNIPPKYRELFKIWELERYNPEEVLKKLRAESAAMRNHPLIQGDRIYCWQADMKLWMEGKIKLLPGEMQTARSATEANFRKLSTKGKITSKELKEAFDPRDEAVIELATSSPVFKDAKYIPIIFGNGHEFKDNVEKLNQRQKRELGLLKIRRISGSFH